MKPQSQQPSARRGRTGPSPRSSIAAVALVACLALAGSVQPLWAAPGSLDTSFGNGGLVLTNLAQASSDLAFAIVIQPDGKMVVAGLSDAGGSFDIGLARYNANGTLDGSFGAAGKVLTDFSSGSDDEGFAMALQPDGKIVVAGLSDAGGNFHFALARYNTDGTLDGGFGSAGKVLTNSSPGSDDSALAVGLQPDGKIVAAGPSGSSFGVARYNANGTLDAGFGSGGTVTTAFGTDTFDQPAALAIQPDGKIVVAGSSDTFIALARYTVNGALDAGFGIGGKVTTAFGTASSDQASAMAVQSDGKLVLAGASDSGGNSAFALARYVVAGPLGPFLEVHANAVAFTTDSSFTLNLVVGNSGAQTNVDFYFGVLLPPSAGGCASNDPILFFVGGFANAIVTCLSAPSPNVAPFAGGIPLPTALPLTTVPDFLTFVWSNAFPAGPYTFFAALADAGTLNIRALGIDTVTFSK